MSRNRKVLLAGALLVVAGGVYVWLGGRGPVEDILARRGLGGGPPAPGGALFPFGNAYLDGRSAWLAERFREVRRSLQGLELPGEVTIDCRVHRAPFTAGAWVESLDAELVRHREETEAQTVETRLCVFLEGVDPGRLFLYLAASGFEERIPGEGPIAEDSYLLGPASAPEDLKDPPPLGDNQWLTRLRWRRPLAKPTAVDYVHAGFRDGEALAIVYEAWGNCGDGDHAVVRLASGQYAMAGRPGGSLLVLLSYYSGQTIPRLMDGIARSLTVSYYQKLSRLIAEEVRSWTPPPEVEARFRAADLP